MALYKEDVETIYTIKFGPVGLPLTIYKQRDTWVSIQDHWKKLCFKIKHMKRDLENHFIFELYINDFLFERRTTRKMYKVYRPMMGDAEYFFDKKLALRDMRKKWLKGFFVILSKSSINIDGWYVLQSRVPFKKHPYIMRIENFRYHEEHGTLIVRETKALSLVNGREYDTNY